MSAIKQTYRQFLTCGAKHGYKSMRKAEKALRDYISDFPHLAEGMNAYECKFCEKFHIGHTDRKIEIAKSDVAQPIAPQESPGERGPSHKQRIFFKRNEEGEMAQEITWRILIEDCEQMIAADLEHIKRLNKSLRYFKLQEAAGSPFPHDHDARRALQSYKTDLARDLQDPAYSLEYLKAAALDSKEALKGAVTNVMGQAIASAEARARLEGEYKEAIKFSDAIGNYIHKSQWDELLKFANGRLRETKTHVLEFHEAAARTLYSTPRSKAARQHQGAGMSQNSLCTCGHTRDQHDMEQPYECFGETAVDESCECRGFTYDPISTKEPE